MKKYGAVVLVAVILLLSWPAKMKAQYYTPYAYNNNAYLNYAIASQKARATRNRGRSVKRRHRSRRVRHARRVRRHARKR